jgi:penicillin G amidase
MKLLRRVLGLALGERLARYDGELEVPGLGAPARVRRDRFGVPYITAESEHDAWLTLGFCHAQERAAQLEIVVRAVRGTLSALVGSEGVPIDRLSRRIGFRRAGEAQLAVAEARVRDQVEAYVRGVNAALSTLRRPHELAMLMREPTRWEAADVQGYATLLCFALASNWDMELMRLSVLVHDGAEALRAIDLPYPEDLPQSLRPLERAGPLVDRLAPGVAAFQALLGTGGGSNAWAIAPQKTATGRPIVACDPHLMSQLPPLLYAAQIRAPGVEIAGGSWVGFPAFAPGHNGFCAWGATAAHADNTDLFLERIGPDGASVQEGESFVPCEVREEHIEVRGGEAIVERVIVTPRGPILVERGERDLVAGRLPDEADGLSLAATWLAPRPYTGLYRAHEVRSFEAMRELFGQGSASTISAVYADVEGHVGWWLGVEIPERKRGHGLVPLPAWDGSAGWADEPVAFDRLPRRLDPDEGFVCTANNQPQGDGEEPFLGADWLDGYRQRRIAERLAERDDWDLDAVGDLQRDVLSLPWQQMRGSVLAVDPSDGEVDLALRLLAAWDGRLAADSVAASVYALFCAEIIARVVRAKAPRSAAWALGEPFTAFLPTSTIGCRRMSHLVRLVVEQPDGWFVDGWPRAMATALRAALSRLRARMGDDPSGWRWGRVRPLHMRHPFGEKPPLHRVFDIGPLEGEGDNTTVSQGGVDYATGVTEQSWVPLLRAVFDVGNWDRCRIAMVGGQSGNPLSPHYDDQLEAWRSGGFPLVWTEEAIERRVDHRLSLVPDRVAREVKHS